MNDLLKPIVRRAIVDLLNDTGGEHNDDVLSMLLSQLGHRVARRDIRDELAWLAEAGLIKTEELGPFIVARVISDGRDVAEGRLVYEGVHRHKTGE